MFAGYTLARPVIEAMSLVLEKRDNQTVHDELITGVVERHLIVENASQDSRILLILHAHRQRLAAAELKVSLPEPKLEQEPCANRVKLEPKLHAALHRIAEMEVSHSWRIARPIRQLTNLVYVLGRRLLAVLVADVSQHSISDTAIKAALLEQVCDHDVLNTGRRLLDVELTKVLPV